LELTKEDLLIIKRVLEKTVCPYRQFLRILRVSLRVLSNVLQTGNHLAILAYTQTDFSLIKSKIMNADSYTLTRLQDLIEEGQKKYQKAIETDKEFEEAKIIYYKIKELKKALDSHNITPELSQYLHSHKHFN
jgi:hypothetical protein